MRGSTLHAAGCRGDLVGKLILHHVHWRSIGRCSGCAQRGGAPLSAASEAGSTPRLPTVAAQGLSLLHAACAVAPEAGRNDWAVETPIELAEAIAPTLNFPANGHGCSPALHLRSRVSCDQRRSQPAPPPLHDIICEASNSDARQAEGRRTCAHKAPEAREDALLVSRVLRMQWALLPPRRVRVQLAHLRPRSAAPLPFTSSLDRLRASLKHRAAGEWLSRDQPRLVPLDPPEQADICTRGRVARQEGTCRATTRPQ